MSLSLSFSQGVAKLVSNVAVAIAPPVLINNAREWSLRRGIRRYKARRVVRSYCGYPLEIQLSDPTAEEWYSEGWSEPDLQGLDLLRKHRLKSGALVFDLGAHQCVWALILARIVGPSGRVIALEPDEHNSQVGAINKTLNAADNLIIESAAAAARSGEIRFRTGFNGFVDDGRKTYGHTRVTARSVDDLAREYGTPDVLFIDVEGYEVHVLDGARSTLASAPDCFIEVHVGAGLERFGGTVEEIVEFFPSASYALFISSPLATSGAVPFAAGHPITGSRFFLTAIGRNR